MALNAKTVLNFSIKGIMKVYFTRLAHQNVGKFVWQASIILSLLLLARLDGIDDFLLINYAETLFEEELYSDALLLYEQILESPYNTDSLLTAFSTIRLASCYLELKEDQKILTLLESLKGSFPPQQEKEKNYLLAIAYRHTGHYQQALNLLTSHQIDEEIKLEIGLNYFYLNEHEQASLYLKSIVLDNLKPNSSLIAQLYLVRIALFKKEIKEAQEYLHILATRLPESHLLYFEMAYLQGLASFLSQDYTKAISYFEKALPKHNEKNCDWYLDTLLHLACSYLKLAESPFFKKKELLDLFSKSENLLNKILSISQEDKFYLILGELYLTKARYLKDQEAYQQAQQLLAQQKCFASPEGQAQALLLRASAAPTYAERKQLYKQFIAETDCSSPFYAQGWYLKGMNDFEEGFQFKEDGLSTTQTSEETLKEAIDAFEQAYPLFEGIDPEKTVLCLKYQALSYYYQNTNLTTKQAWILLNQLINQKSHLLQHLEEPEQIYYLTALIAIHLLPQDRDPSFLKQIEKILKDGINHSHNSRWTDELMKTLGIFYFKERHLQEADKIFEEIVNRVPHSRYLSEAWFWRAKCAEVTQDFTTMRQYLRHVFIDDPQSLYAPQAYFSYYSYQEYLQGSRKAIKHLQAMPCTFPDHPLLITGYYLIGLDHKKDHLSEEGNIQRRKNLTAAIDAFQQAESTFDLLYQKGLIPSSDLSYFFHVRYRATLERAFANLAIAEDSQGTKRQIYLSYAEHVFKQIIENFHQPEPLVRDHFLKDKEYPPLLKEAEFWLAQIAIQEAKFVEAEKWLDHMLVHYQKACQTRGYLLSRTWYEKGKISQEHKEFATALNYFLQAEKTAQGLSPDQKLDLWIQQSLCYKDLNQIDEAMRILSKVINDEILSELRLKAMFLRAEMYELQGRPELAFKQLEATAKKEGEWGQKAKDKLEKDYGYQ